MAILAFDLGGSSVKYGVWTSKRINKSELSNTWLLGRNESAFIFGLCRQKKWSISGVAFSSPGVVDEKSTDF